MPLNATTMTIPYGTASNTYTYSAVSLPVFSYSLIYVVVPKAVTPPLGKPNDDINTIGTIMDTSAW